jgi:chemotaxis protein CheC
MPSVNTEPVTDHAGAGLAPPVSIIPEMISRLAGVQMDALREIANIGAGHAATALSEMTGRPVAIGVPTVSVAARGSLSDCVGRSDLPMILARIRASGAFSGGLVIAFTESAARQLTDLLLGRDTTGHGWLDEIAASAVKEVTNILGAAYLNALASLTGWTIPISTPKLIYARADWAMSLLCVDQQPCDVAICLDTSFRIEGTATEVRGHVLLFPATDTVQTLLFALGV